MQYGMNKNSCQRRGTTSAGIGQRYGSLTMRPANSALTRASSSGSAISRAPVSAMVAAAKRIALCATPLLPMATACQLCAGVSAAHAAAETWPVGAHQLASPTSVETGITGASPGVYGAMNVYSASP